MAEKKIFTSLAFQSGAKLIAPKVEIVQAENNLTTPTGNNTYYTGSAGQLAYNNGNIWVNNDSIWTKLLNHASTATISGNFTFDRVDNNSNGIAPFIIGSESENVLVAGLNADQVDGSHTSNAVGNNTIPVRDSSSLFHVGASSYTESAYDSHGDTQVANKALVAAGIAKLVNSAPAALDTLEELAGALGDDAAFSTTVNTSLGNRLRIDVNNQGLTSTELTNARTNLGLGTLATLNSVGNSEIADDAVRSNHIADGQITPAQLVNSSSFTMGGLTVNGDIANTGNINSGGFLYLKSGGSAYGELGLDGNKPRLRAYGSSGWLNVITVDNNSGKLGLGADASSPSGTLHVSTARYGNNILTGDNADYSVSDEAAANSIKYGWEPYGSNTIAVTNEQIVITNVDNNQTAYRYLNPTTIGRKYKVQIDAKYTGSGSAAVLRLWNGATMTNVATLTTSLVTYTATFERVASAPYWKFDTASGQSVTVDNLSIVEDSLASATGSDFAVADDLVINNGLTQAGMTLLGSGGARIHFGESGNSAHSSIVGTYDSNKDSSLFFGASNDGTAATVMTLFGNDKSAKFEGGVGIGMAAGTNQKLSVKSYDSSLDQITLTHSGNTVNIVQIGQSTTNNGNGAILLKNNSGVDKIYLDAAATSYFNGGNVAIGGTSVTALSASTRALHIQGTNAECKTEATDSSGWAFSHYKSPEGSWTVGIDDDDVFRISNNSSLKTNTGLIISTDGTQDHKANSIVNSATVAGLQDGACYYIGATGDAIDTGYGNGLQGENRSYSIWVKLDSISGSQMIAASNNGTNQRLYIGLSDSKWVFGSFNTAWDSAIGDDISGTFATPVANKWTHVSLTVGTRYAKLYVDGVLTITRDHNWQDNSTVIDYNLASNIFLGNHGTGTGYPSYGSYRDFKVIASELDAADIRKLYSGENPKKNLNVELIANGDFSDSIGSEWAGSTDATLTQNNGQLTVTSSASTYGAAYAPISITEGKCYLLTFDMVDTDANSYIRVGTIDATNKTGPQQVSSNILSNAVVADGTTVRTIFVASSSQASDGYLAFGGRNDMTTLVLDNVSLTEVGTLVDFNPQSASSTKWRNEAIPALYNGTVNNATLSQGNTYWNNIKQDGQATTVDGSLEVQTASGGELNIERNGNSGVAIQLKNNGDIASGTLKLAGGSGVTLFTNATEALSTAGGDVKVAAKLGVGGVASSCTLRVAGTSEFENTLYLGDCSGYRGLISWSGDFDSGVGSAHHHMVLSGSNTAANAGIQFKTRATSGGTASNVDAGVVSADGNWGLRSTKPRALLDINSTANTGYPLLIRGDLDANDRYTGIKFGLNGTGATNNYFKAAIQVRATTGHVQPDMHFMLEPAASWTSVEDSDAHRVLSLRNDGTHDHQGNRIVNSQTLNDSWRSAEPSLRFDGSNDRVSVASNSALDFSGNFTISAWIKLKDYTANTTQAIVHRQNGGIRYYMAWRGNSSDIIQVAINGDGGSNYDINSATNAITDNDWHHIVATIDRGVNNHKIYVDGVQSGSTATGGTTGPINPDAPLMIGSNGDASGSFFDGEIRDVRLYNRAMEADEVKGLYNGEATPYIYANGGEAVLALNDFSSSDMTGWNSTSEATNYPTATSGKITYFSTSGANYPSLSAPAMTLVEGRTYKVKFDIWSDDASATDNVFVKIGKAQSGGAANVTGSNDVFDSNLEIDPTGSAVTYERSFTAGESCTAYVVFRGGSSSTLFFNVDNISVVTEGEVAAYTPKSIGGKWYDTTSNNNHGGITGATAVNKIDFLGDQTIRSDGTTRLTVDGAGTGYINAGLILRSNSGSNARGSGVFMYDYGGDNEWFAGRPYQTSDGYIISRQAPLTVPSNGSTAEVSKAYFHVETGGTVKATSASSGNLKQVARVESGQVTWPNNTAANVAFRIDHNLGAAAPIVQVYEDASPYGLVDIEVRQGDWIGADVGAVGADVQGADTAAKNVNKLRYVTVVFAKNPGWNTKWNYRVTG